MGLEGGEMPGRAEGDLGSMQAIHYAAVIANELMRHQEGLEDRVRPGDCGCHELAFFTFFSPYFS